MLWYSHCLQHPECFTLKETPRANTWEVAYILPNLDVNNPIARLVRKNKVLQDISCKCLRVHFVFNVLVCV